MAQKSSKSHKKKKKLCKLSALMNSKIALKLKKKLGEFFAQNSSSKNTPKKNEKWGQFLTQKSEKSHWKYRKNETKKEFIDHTEKERNN